jgi:hypothetical protein
LLLFSRRSAFFFEKKKQKTFIRFVAANLFGRAGACYFWPMPQAAFPADGAFPAGTLITVERFGHGIADVAVEDLSVGDQVVVQTRGDARTRKLRRIDRRHFAHPPPGAAVRIAAGALGAGLPRRDLVLPAEALLLIRELPEPALVPAGALANGAGINADAADLPDIWFTLELDAHDILSAEGAAVGSRRAAPLCAPILPPGPPLAAIRRRLAHGTPVDELVPAVPFLPPAPEPAAPQPSADPARPLRILADASELEAGDDGVPHTYVVALPPGTGKLHLVSRSAPSPAPNDGRRLGVCVIEISLDGVPLPLDATGPGAVTGPGFHPVEPDASDRRWTNGDAWLLLPHSAAPRTLRLRTNDWHMHLPPG